MDGTGIPHLADRLGAALPALGPEQARAAAHLIDNPGPLAVSTVRQVADAAGVKPTTIMRLARAAGFSGFEEMRAAARAEALSAPSFPDRARWLQALARGGRHDALYAEMAGTAIDHIEAAFAGADAGRVRAAADAIRRARRLYVLGVGIAHGPARSFAYLASMLRDEVEVIPREGGVPLDDLARAGPGDALLAMTFRPFRVAVLEAAEAAREAGAALIGISDSAASPLLAGADHGFVAPVDTPQFFTSTFAVQALLDTIVAFVASGMGEEAAERIEAVEARRAALGIYRGAP